MNSEFKSRRAVRGLACRDCEFCGRVRTDKDGKTLNYQYINEKTGDWDKEVFCSKDCRKAWRSLNNK